MGKRKNMGKTISITVLKVFYNLLIDYIDKRMDLVEKKNINCPDCGATIRSKTCPYCGTNLINWYKIGE